LAGPPSPSCFAPTVQETRSPQRFVASTLEIKPWRDRLPTCAEARPGCCPCCRAAAQPIGGRLVIVGHGLLERQVLGPVTASGRPEQGMVTLRRYRCRACKAVLLVGPRGLVARRWYSGGAMALALAAYGRGETGVAARLRTSPSREVGPSAKDRWVTLVRWIEAARGGELFGVAGLGDLGRRRIAEQVALALAGRAGHTIGADLTESAFAGASIAA
jgi:hypothetical protein